jgi:TfoX/Sxy family transcriptional regulator of competence genes
MATDQATIDELLDRLRDAGRVTAKKMFGEFCVYLDGKPVALVCDDVLYVKPTTAGRALKPGVEEGPPYAGAKDHLMFPADQWADGEFLCRLVRTTHEHLPVPKPRNSKAGRRRAGQ